MTAQPQASGPSVATVGKECGATLFGVVGHRCDLPPGHPSPHAVTYTPAPSLFAPPLPHRHWTGEPCPACDEGEQLQTEAALDRLIEGGVLVEERDDAGRVRHVTEWRDPEPPSYERLQGLVHLAEEVIGAVRGRGRAPGVRDRVSRRAAVDDA